MEAVFALQPSDGVGLSGDERDVEVGRETQREYRMTEEGEMAKYITSRFKTKTRERQLKRIVVLEVQLDSTRNHSANKSSRKWSDEAALLPA